MSDDIQLSIVLTVGAIAIAWVVATTSLKFKQLEKIPNAPAIRCGEER